MNAMQLRSQPRRNPSDPRSLRARGRDRSCRAMKASCVSPTRNRVKSYPRRASCTLAVTCTRDPIGFEGSKWNLYEFLGSQITSTIDPSGLAFCHVREFVNCALLKCVQLNIQAFHCAAICVAVHRRPGVGRTRCMYYCLASRAPLTCTNYSLAFCSCVAALKCR